LCGAKELKNHKILDWCEEKKKKQTPRELKKVKFEKRCKMMPWTQKSALIQPLTNLGKGLKI